VLQDITWKRYFSAGAAHGAAPLLRPADAGMSVAKPKPGIVISQ
jgi:hypothetical protein